MCARSWPANLKWKSYLQRRCWSQDDVAAYAQSVHSHLPKLERALLLDRNIQRDLIMLPDEDLYDITWEHVELNFDVMYGSFHICKDPNMSAYFLADVALYLHVVYFDRGLIKAPTQTRVDDECKLLGNKWKKLLSATKTLARNNENAKRPRIQELKDLIGHVRHAATPSPNKSTWQAYVRHRHIKYAVSSPTSMAGKRLADEVWLDDGASGGGDAAWEPAEKRQAAWPRQAWQSASASEASAGAWPAEDAATGGPIIFLAVLPWFGLPSHI